MAADDVDRGLIEQQLRKWVREHVAFPDVKLHGRCGKVVLRHLNLEGKPQGDVGAIATKIEEGAEEDGIEPLLHQIAEKLQGDADNVNQGVQTYGVYASYPSDRGYVPRYKVRVAPSDVEIQRDFAPTEPPTEKGLVAQMQRHLEAILRTTTVATGHVFQLMQGEIKRMAEMNEKFAGQQIDVMILMQDLVDNTHGRRIKEREAEANLAMKESALGKLEMVAPVLLNRLAGKQIFPEENRSLMLMAQLLETMSPEQQAAFEGGLTQGQKIALAEVLHNYEEGKSKWIQTEKKTITLNSKNHPPSSQKTGDAPVEQTLPMPTALSLRERLKLTARPSDDPQIQKIEQDAQAFSNRFRDMLKPTGDPK
jgi:hypothetical protein